MRVEFSSAFPWGLLLARDSESAESIGPWAESAEVVTSCATALVVRVQHEQEGDVAVTVMTAENPPSRHCGL